MNRETGPQLVVARQKPVRIRYQEPPPRVAVTGGHLGDRSPRQTGGLVGTEEQLDFGRFAHGARELRHSGRGDPAFVSRGQGRALGPSPPSCATAAAASTAASSRAPKDRRYGRILSSHRRRPDPGAPVAPGGELLDLSVVERDGGARPVLGEDLCEIAASSQRFVQDPLEDAPLDEIGRRSFDDAQNFRPSMPPSTAPAAAPPAAVL